MKELGETRVSAMPKITYSGFGSSYPAEMPFKFIVDTENLGGFMTKTMGYDANLVSNTTIDVTTGSVPSIEVGVGPAGLSISSGIIRGVTESVRNPQGKMVIRVNTGDLISQFLRTKADLISYSYLSKKTDVPYSLRRGNMAVKEATRRSFVDPKRMLEYLKQTPIDRVDDFLNKFLARKFTLAVAEVLIHETTHLAQIPENEALREKLKKCAKLENATGVVSVWATVSGLLEALINEQQAFLLYGALIGIPAFAAHVYLGRKVRKHAKNIMDLRNSDEEAAKTISQEYAAVNRTDLVILTQNPSYEKNRLYSA